MELRQLRDSARVLLNAHCIAHDEKLLWDFSQLISECKLLKPATENSSRRWADFCGQHVIYPTKVFYTSACLCTSHVQWTGHATLVRQQVLLI